MKWKRAIRLILFFAILAAALAGASSVMSHSQDSIHNQQRLRGFYAEPKNSLDAVYIGASNVYTFWVPPVAWKNYGIAVYSLSSSSQPLSAAEYLIREARKTQPDALYIVAINNNLDRNAEDAAERYVKESTIHFTADALPLSKNKSDMVERLSDVAGYDLWKRLEFYFPLIRYHSRWSELSEEDYTADDSDNVKGAIRTNMFKGHSEDVSSYNFATEQRAELREGFRDTILSLLDYCDSEHVNVLFVTPPQMVSDISILAQFNAVSDLIKERGYPVLDLRECMDEIGLDPKTDYYNESHNNIHGALKTTDYTARYLLTHYHFDDKRGDARYADWDDAYRVYREEMSTWAVDAEFTECAWDNTLPLPELNKVSASGSVLTVSWKNSTGADGYRVYRKTNETGWEAIADTDPDTLSFEDENCIAGTQYVYTVIPWREEDGERLWASFNPSYVKGTAGPGPVTGVELFREDGKIVLTWEEQEGVDGYRVFRQIPSNGWIQIADLDQTGVYVDDSALEGLPYLYMLRAELAAGDGSYTLGNSSVVLLLLPESGELAVPEISMTLNDDGLPDLNWDRVEWASGYIVERKAGDGKWTQIANNLPVGSTHFADITVRSGVSYVYRITPFFDHSGKRYSAAMVTEAIESETTRYVLPAPEFLYAEQVGKNIQILWAQSGGATAYRVYRREVGATNWEIVSTSQNAESFRNRPDKPGTYEYLVQALRSQNGCTYLGEFSEKNVVTVQYEG